MHPKQNGVAIIMVLLVFFMATVIMSGIMLQQHYAIKQSGYLFATLQSQQYAIGAEARARQILYRDVVAPANGNKAIDYVGEAWAAPKNEFVIEQGKLFYRIEDLQGRFNVNNVSKGGVWVERFQALLTSLEINPKYAQRLFDWLDADSETSGVNGAEDGDYLFLKPPYRTANQLIMDVSELRLLGMTEKEYQALLPYVAALPLNAPINVNTVSARVLGALAPGLSSAVLGAITAQQRNGIKSVGDFLKIDGVPATLQDDGALSVLSEYFAVYSEVAFDERHTELKSVLHRDSSGNIKLLSRDFSINATMSSNDEAADQPKSDSPGIENKQTDNNQ